MPICIYVYIRSTLRRTVETGKYIRHAKIDVDGQPWITVSFTWNIGTHRYSLEHTGTHCNTLQHTATHCNTQQHIATHCNTLQHTATHCNILQHAY